MDLTHLDLFSGIGGFALAAENAGFRTLAFCEKDPFCQRVLRKHWPDIPCHEEVRTLDGRPHRGVAVLTAGFPCQPYSLAGKQRPDDDRILWPETLRVLREAEPAWFLGENVPGIINLALDGILADLESAGYEAQAFVIPACAVNAPHKRDRVWILAHAHRARLEGQPGHEPRERERERERAAGHPPTGHLLDFWPTPSASEHKYRLRGSSQQSRCLEAMARTWMKEALSIPKGSAVGLNPAFVEWLMGYPIGWTASEPSATPSSLKSPSNSCAG